MLGGPLCHCRFQYAKKDRTHPTAPCMWCGKGFALRVNGGKPQVFCRTACRRAFDAVGRRWVAEVIAASTLTLDSLRNGAAATRALLPEAVSPASLSVPQKPAL